MNGICTFHIAAAAKGPISVQRRRSPRECAAAHARSSRRVESLRTQAYFHAAAEYTGCASAYALELQFGPNPPRLDSTSAGWASQRPMMFDRWKRGCSCIGSLLARGSPEAAHRLARIRGFTRWPDEVLAMPLWRCLETADLTIREFVGLNSEVEAYAFKTSVGAKIESATYASDTVALLSGIMDPATRRAAMSGLWLCMRSCVALADLGTYVHRYLLWLWFQPLLCEDRVFGPIASALYDYTTRHFSHVMLVPDNDDTRAAANFALAWSSARVDGDSGVVATSVEDIDRLLSMSGGQDPHLKCAASALHARRLILERQAAGEDIAATARCHAGSAKIIRELEGLVRMLAKSPRKPRKSAQHATQPDAGRMTDRSS